MATAKTVPITFKQPKCFYIPPTSPSWYKISGVTKDSVGSVLPNCIVKLYRTIDDQLVRTVISDSTGQYWFDVAGDGLQYYVKAYLAGNPDVAGTTFNTLVGA